MTRSGWILASLLVLGASRPTSVVVSPSRPTVGDLITVTFPPDVQRVFLGQGGGYEVVGSEGNRVVVRSFRPGTLSLAAQLVRKGGSSRLALNLTVHSVLAPNDAMEPAPLQPPRPLPPNRAARIAIAIAVPLALSSWLAALLLSRRRSGTTPERKVAPIEEFRNALVGAARTRDPNERLIQLAAATRVYLARSREELGTELTTFELVRRLQPAEARGTILELLTAADLAKFSPWGAENRDYGHLLERLARIPDTFEPRAVAA